MLNYLLVIYEDTVVCEDNDKSESFVRIATSQLCVFAGTVQIIIVTNCWLCTLFSHAHRYTFST